MKGLLSSVLLLSGCLGALVSASANDALLPSSGVNVAHYESLWSKSPFAVASAGPAEEGSPDYTLVGTAQFDGVSYASLIDNKKQHHLLLSTKSSDEGLALLSIDSAPNAPCSALVNDHGKTVRLVVSQPVTTLRAVHVSDALGASGPNLARAAIADASCPPLPASGRVPLLFQALGTGAVPLNDDQRDRISQLRHEFVGQLGDYPNPNDSGYQKRWQQAQAQADDSMRAILGQDKFTAYETAAMQNAQTAAQK